MRRFGVAFYAWCSLMTDFVPQNFPSGAIESEDSPFVRRLIIGGCRVAVEADFQVCFAGADGADQIDAIAPGDWRGV